MTGHYHFYLWADGTEAVAFDPLLRTGFGAESMPTEWKRRMDDVGIDPAAEGPSPDGRFHFVESSFAMAANYTGIDITPDLLANTHFAVGEADDY